MTSKLAETQKRKKASVQLSNNFNRLPALPASVMKSIRNPRCRVQEEGRGRRRSHKVRLRGSSRSIRLRIPRHDHRWGWRQEYPRGRTSLLRRRPRFSWTWGESILLDLLLGLPLGLLNLLPVLLDLLPGSLTCPSPSSDNTCAW